MFAVLPSAHLTAMVRLCSSLALLSACVLPFAHAGPFEVLSSTTDSLARFGLSKVLRLNETQIDRVLKTEVAPLEPHPYAGTLCCPRSPY